MATNRNDKSLIVCDYYAWRLFRRDGVYYADGRGNTPNLGKHSVGTRDREEALKNLRRLDQAMAIQTGKARPTESIPQGVPTIAGGWESYLDHCGRPGVMRGATTGTLKRYGAVRGHHLTFCRKRGIETWLDFDLQQFRAYGHQREKNAADGTLYFELNLLKSITNWLVDAERLPASSRNREKLAKPQGTNRYCYQPVEVRAMLEYCAARPELHWLGLVILALAHTGMRIGELAGLRWSDLDSGLITIRIADERSNRKKKLAGTARTTKGKKSRTIPIHPKLREALAMLDRSQGGWVFRAPRGGRLRTRNMLQQFLDKVIEPLTKQFPTPEGEIGFADGVLHSFRHFFISQALLNGATEGEVREWVGHTDSKLIEHYRTLHAEDARRRMQSLDLLGEQRAAAEATTDANADRDVA